MKILLIEDDRELAESMRFQLEKEGYETDICDDGEEGLYYMKERSHDLVILDRMLPSMDGITVLQEARKNHVSTPVIMLTALGELQDKLTGLKGGADDYMVKPFAFEELLARIQCMVRRPGRWEDTAVLSLGDLIFDPERQTGRKRKGMYPFQTGRSTSGADASKRRSDTSERGNPQPCLGSRQRGGGWKSG